MRKYPKFNKESQLRIWLNQNEFKTITNEQLTLLEESEFCEVSIYPYISMFSSRRYLRVVVWFNPFTEVNRKWSRSYYFRIRRSELL